MQFSNDEQHAQTLALLKEVRDYIASWPPHPMNRETIQRIDSHLADPLRSLVAKSVPVRTGSSYSLNGVPVLSAVLEAATLTVQVPPVGQSLDDGELLSRLRQGEVLDLHPRK